MTKIGYSIYTIQDQSAIGQGMGKIVYLKRIDSRSMTRKTDRFSLVAWTG